MQKITHKGKGLHAKVQALTLYVLAFAVDTTACFLEEHTKRADTS